MRVISRPTVVALLLLFVLTPTFAQQKRQTPPKQPPPQTKAAPPPTFDTLVPAESYTIYGEVRGVGTVIRSSAVTEALEPIMKLSGPPKEFRTIVKWLQNHADELMTSRLLLATWPIRQDLPEAIIAIEFASAEEAAKVAAPLNTVLTNVVPKVTETAPKPAGAENAEASTVSKPGYHLQQVGSLIVLTPKPITLKNLRPAGSKSVTEDANLRTARNRFSSESIFVFVNVKLIERQEEERRKSSEESRKAEEEQLKQERAKATEEEKKEEEAPESSSEDHFTSTEIVKDGPVLGITTEVPPDQMLSSLSLIGSAFFSGQSKWPDGVGLALEIGNDSIDLRALFVNEPGEKSDLVPFLPTLIPGPPIVPESPNILPADSQLVATFSLDLPQIYAAMTKPTPPPTYKTGRGEMMTLTEAAGVDSPFELIEKKLKLNLKDDVLPLLGSEVSLRLPVTGLDVFGLPKGPSPVEPTGKDSEAAADTSPLVLIQLRDKEGVRALMPKIVEALGFKGANSFAQTERKEDTEIVSYVNVFSYAFVGNFLVLSSDPASVRKLVDSYLKHETLASEPHFRNSTRWQPRPSYGQLYVSPALMESYKTWAEQTKQISDTTRVFLTRLASVAQPITYSLSNEGLGPLHELHVPKNLVLMAVAGISGESNPTPVRQNEGGAMSTMYMIAYMEEQYKKDKGAGSYGTLEQLIATNMVPKDMLEHNGYKFEMTVTGDKFELFAVPTEYGKTGTFSYFIDQSRVLRGADRGGASATSSDPPIR